MDENNGIFDDSRLFVLLLVMGSVSVLVTIYHCLSVCWGNRQAQQVPGQRPQGPEPNGPRSINYSSTVQLIPAHKYQKGMHMVGDDGVCAVCLGEFEEGEDLRTLPECLHSFHVPCIDMWLYSHPNCPVCRTDTTPLPQVLQISVPAAR